ncbi:MAG TPA: prepilin-type N-terminal cleavage/methylation domain-containing protein [Balneolales bacterium]|nr:prepilin-type N-terminal cleavage/methylation domain-containing protein [Balneolales bacterium]
MKHKTSDDVATVGSYSMEFVTGCSRKGNGRSPLKTLLVEEQGWSLTELMVVLVIIGILVMLAIPIYRNITTKAKTTEAKIMLGQVMTLEKAYYLEHDVYSKDLAAIGFEQNKLITNGGRARYVIKLVKADQNGFEATATSVVDFNRNGVFNVWEVTQDGMIKEKTPD